MLLSHPVEPWMPLPKLILIEFALCGCKSESQPTKHAVPPPDANCNGNWRGADDNIGRPTCAAFVGHGGRKIGTQWWWWPSQRNYYLHMPVCVRVCLCVGRLLSKVRTWLVVMQCTQVEVEDCDKKKIYTKMFLLSNSRQQQQRWATTIICKWETGVVFRYQRPVGARRLLQKLPDLRDRSCETCQTTRAHERAFVLKCI